ncbi:hypothetical protein [Bacillus sp. MUM 13]|uniref:hypothetical protein n=1 Tax=Bacillus sp. MUM 13 TaxID=1678001 RepID=UPI0008F5D39A|nr:hypothetical protein [Bacillus sp. MUM 13]OIK12642.1 hypothetical protein BIV59_08105 [Bacillus sp. MUM 13]
MKNLNVVMLLSPFLQGDYSIIHKFAILAVQPGADIELKIDYDHQPNKVHLTHVNGKKEIVSPVEKGHFKAPGNP